MDTNCAIYLVFMYKKGFQVSNSRCCMKYVIRNSNQHMLQAMFKVNLVGNIIFVFVIEENADAKLDNG